MLGSIHDIVELPGGDFIKSLNLLMQKYNVGGGSCQNEVEAVTVLPDTINVNSLLSNNKEDRLFNMNELFLSMLGKL